MKEPLFFGVRHLSPAGAYHLRRFLEENRPKLVLVEGPEDFNDLLENLVRQETQPPVAVLAYTSVAPVRTILYPFAEYSPEYQAILWCRENGVECRFMDLPSDVFLSFGEHGAVREQGEEERFNVYRALDEQTGEDGHETFWERTLEHTDQPEAYRQGAAAFGRSLRMMTQGQEDDWAETVAREAYMSRRILDAVEDGLEPGEIVAVTGAYHVEGLRAAFGRTWREKDPKEYPEGRDEYLQAGHSVMPESGTAGVGSTTSEDSAPAAMTSEEIFAPAAMTDEEIFAPAAMTNEEIFAPAVMTDEEIAALPRISSSHTLMPYSFYRLSSRSGYGAGNKAPAYYGLLWEALRTGEPHRAAYSYLARIAGFQREHGSQVSSAEVIEAVRLASSLAKLRSGRESVPALRDLRDAAVTCMGGGSFAAVSLAVADTEIGTAIGFLPEGVSRTSIQEDFYRQLKDLKLEKYRDLTAQDLALDLRENRMVKTQKAAFMDLNRSFFLHRIRVLGISFAKPQAVSQDNATWAESWILRWMPEAEIELVEAALKGDTVLLAASFEMKERVENAGGMGDIALVIEDAFLSGMPESVGYATGALQAMAVDAAALEDLAATAKRLSVVLQYGNIRRLDPAPLKPILQQLFYRSCLLLPGACVCDDAGSKMIAVAVGQLNDCALAHDFLDQEAWLKALDEMADRDDLNTRLSGLAAAILLERGAMDTARLHLEVQRRLSKGVPADLGAGWFEGLAMKNRYALIARLPLWESLDNYLETLDDEEFKRALVFLRRAFADFTSGEKDEIAENLGEIWGLNKQQVSEAVNTVLPQEAAELLDSLDDFDFDI